MTCTESMYGVLQCLWLGRENQCPQYSRVGHVPFPNIRGMAFKSVNWEAGLSFQWHQLSGLCSFHTLSACPERLLCNCMMLNFVSTFLSPLPHFVYISPAALNSFESLKTGGLGSH
uniref:Uncharacterized protein n=1 Tax=Sphaerodactylus townsendi TaxID=933632 RepID=A0ACB8EZZ6_9SAUR